MDHSRNKKGLHELKRKQNRKRMRLHKWTTEGKIGPEGKDLAHHHAWSKPETKKQEQARLAKGLADAIRSEALEGAGAQQVDPKPEV